MKTKSIIATILLALILTSCTPPSTPTPPTVASVPTATSTPVPPQTITPTPAPENIANAKDLSVWVEEYVHAFGGTVTINDVDMDANQLTDEIRANEEKYLASKQVNGEEVLFLKVNGIPLAQRKMSEQHWQVVSLKYLADSLNIQFGSQIVHYELTNLTYSKIALSEFNLYLTNGELDYSPRWIGEDRFDYSAADEFFTFTAKTGKPVHMYHLLDGENIPDWLANSAYSRENYIEIMQGRVHSIMEKYRGQIELYSVVNEAFDWNKLKGFWFEKIGSDYIEIAFRVARETDPKAILIYNDVNVSNGAIDDHENTVLDLVLSLKKQGLLDGVGMQMHVDASQPFDREGFLQNLLRYKKNGVAVYITQFDVDMSHVVGSEAQRQQIKAELFRDVLAAYLDSGAGSSFCLFGFSSAVSWIPESDAHIFDSSFHPQRAYYSTLQVLYENLP